MIFFTGVLGSRIVRVILREASGENQKVKGKNQKAKVWNFIFSK